MDAFLSKSRTACVPLRNIENFPAGSAQCSIGQRLARVDWQCVGQSLDQFGHVVLPGLVTPDECNALIDLYRRDALYRARIVMVRHGFGRGEYKYFDYPLPDLVDRLRTSLYPNLVPIANRWNESMRIDVRYPRAHAEFIRRCHAAGQCRPTPLILRYGPGDYNCLHQDLYGEHVFPLQVVILLSRPGEDFDGGEFVMTEQGTRQRRAEVVPLNQADAAVFAVHQRPAQGPRGSSRVALRHGVSRIRSGRRYAAGIIFHDAR